MTKVKALYDFSGEPNSSEICITAGDILTITRTDVGEGWWEGTKPNGEKGLFPEAYVEIINDDVSNNNTATNNGNHRYSRTYSNRTADNGGAEDDWDDDWDDDTETYSEIHPPNVEGHVSQEHQQRHMHSRNSESNSQADDTVSIATTTSGATMRKAGIFSKSGDSYILGTTVLNVNDKERVYIYQTDNNCYRWKQTGESYTVKVASPKKETKFKGMKSFIAYQLTPSFNNISVSRRYKHFDWLHKLLVEKFSLIPIPPLPDKQISGRYEEQFVEHRRSQLQEFVDWMCRHPVLSSCDVWMHFLTCTDEKKWKIGKRNAEKDRLVGVNYCAAINPPEKQLLPSQVDLQTECCSQFVQNMDKAVKTLFAITNEQVKRYQVHWRKDYQLIGDGFSELARALEIDERRAVTNICLSNSVAQTAGVYINIGQMFADQPKNDWIPFSDRLHIYRGLLSEFPAVLSTHKGCIQKRKECEKLTAEHKMENMQMQQVNRRTDIMSYALLAEMTHFRSERDSHLKEAMRNLITEQMNFYQQIIEKLQMAQRLLD